MSLNCPCPAVSLSWGGRGVPVPRQIRGVESLLEAGGGTHSGNAGKRRSEVSERGNFPVKMG